MKSLTRTALVLVNLPVWASTQDWRDFRGPTGDGHSTAADPPLTWSATENVAWVTEIPGRGWSSPVIQDGKIYLTTAVVVDGKPESDPQADRSLRALCVDAATGAIVWDVAVFHQDGATAPKTLHHKNSHASPTPIVTPEGRLYVHFGHQGTACLDLNGKKRWENRSLTYPPMHGNGSTPVLEDGKLIFNCDGEADPFIAALDAETGKVAWKTPRPETEQRQKFSFATCAVITVEGQRQVISPGAGAVDALNPATGEPIWRVAYEGYSVVPKPIYVDGRLFLTSSFDTPEVLAINPVGASGDVTETHVLWINNKKAPMTVALTVIGKEIYWVTDKGGLLTCADVETGEAHWSERIGSRDISASPLYVGGHLYIQEESGKAHVIKPGLTYEKIAENDLGERTLASYAPLDGAFIIRSETKLWRIGKKP